MDYQAAFEAVTGDPRYQENLDWGEPRPGHPEGAVRAHVAELERNLEAFRHRFSDEECWKLRLLIHTHDTFKREARPGVAITDPRSHASLAREFLAGHCPDPDLLAMVQFHDEPYALWRKVRFGGRCNPDRLTALLAAVADWKLFLAFVLIDGCTAGKDREPLQWFLREVRGKVATDFTEDEILPAPEAKGDGAKPREVQEGGHGTDADAGPQGGPAGAVA
jgi:hypothetical protein